MYYLVDKVIESLNSYGEVKRITKWNEWECNMLGERLLKQHLPEEIKSILYYIFNEQANYVSIQVTTNKRIKKLHKKREVIHLTD